MISQTTMKTELMEDFGRVGDFFAALVRDSQSGEKLLWIRKFATDSGGVFKPFGRGIMIPHGDAGALLDKLSGVCVGEERAL